MDSQLFIQLGILLSTTIAIATYLGLTALGGMYSEKSGVVNIGLEGMMIFGAFLGVVFTLNAEYFLSPETFGQINLLFGMLGAALGGLLFAILHAFLSIKMKMDQIISGTAVNIIALGLALYMCQIWFGQPTTPAILSDGRLVTILGVEIYTVTIISIILVFITYYVFNSTKWGKHTLAVGENPHAAAAMGINVERKRRQAVLISGVLAGIGGFAIVIMISGTFSGITVAGKGFIAIAVLIFGRWTPKGIVWAALLFGVTSALAAQLPTLFPALAPIKIYLDILPFVITIIALSIFSRNAYAPKALGTIYDKETR